MLLRKIDDLKKKYSDQAIQRMVDLYAVKSPSPIVIKDRILFQDKDVIQGIISLKLYESKGGDKFYLQNNKEQLSPEFVYNFDTKGFRVEKDNYLSEQLDKQNRLFWLQDFR